MFLMVSLTNINCYMKNKSNNYLYQKNQLNVKAD